MKRTARLKLKPAEIKMLWEALCKHQEKYMVPTNPLTWNPADCNDCVLGFIPHQPKMGWKRDVCFLIWHEKILEKKKERK